MAHRGDLTTLALTILPLKNNILSKPTASSERRQISRTVLISSFRLQGWALNLLLAVTAEGNKRCELKVSLPPEQFRTG